MNYCSIRVNNDFFGCYNQNNRRTNNRNRESKWIMGNPFSEKFEPLKPEISERSAKASDEAR